MASQNDKNAFVFRGMVIQPPSDDEPPVQPNLYSRPAPVTKVTPKSRPAAPGQVVALQKNLVGEVFADMVTETPSERPYPLVVLDCANIGHFFGNNNGFDARGVQLALDYFRGMRIEVKAFIPSSYIRIKPKDHSIGNALMQTDDVSLLNSLVDSLQVTVVPAGDSDDAYILNYARNNNGFIVSNDLFNDHVKNLENQNAEKGMRVWLNDNRSGYTFVENREFMINPVSNLAFRLRNHQVQMHITSSRDIVMEPDAQLQLQRLMKTMQTLTDLCYELYDLKRPQELKHVLLARVHLLLEVCSC